MSYIVAHLPLVRFKSIVMENIRPDIARELYENLGKLFYATAAADEEVQKEEIRVLDEIVKKEWQPIEDSKDEFGTDLSFQIEVIFDWYKDNKLSSECAFQKFVAYKREHDKLFDDHLKSLVWKTACRIAAAFPKKDRSEVLLLIRLKDLLHVKNSVTKICQSCGSSFDINCGTNWDLSLNEDYCSACFANGKFLNPALTLRKLEMELQEKAEKNDEMNIEEMERLKSILPSLKRWKPHHI